MHDAETRVRTGEVLPLTHSLNGALVGADPRSTMNDEDFVEASRLGYPLVAAAPSRKDGMGLAAGGAVALLLGAATFMGLSSGREVTDRPAAAPIADQSPAAPAPPPPGGESVLIGGQPGAPPASLVFSPARKPLQLGGFPVQSAAPEGPSPLSQRLRSPTLLVDLSGPVAAGPAASARSGAPAIAAAVAAGDAFTARADASAGETATATRLAQPAHTVIQGTLIPAVLETAINSDLPGYVRALVSQDVRSFDGSRVLIPRSSRLIGQYRSGLNAGQTRTYVLWSRLIRPDGASVALASPATDEAGTTGLTGEVQSHFFKRFGSALLLSVVGAAGAIASGGASMLVAGGGASAANSAAQQSGSIPPTVRVPQGQPIRVFTARDLDFSSVAR